MIVLDRISQMLNKVLMCVAACFLAAMILLTCANIFLRFVWMPIRGTFELMGYFGAVATAFALGYTQIRRGHIAVDILVVIFSRKPRRILKGINDFICMVFFFIVAWQITKLATNLWETGEITETLRIIYYPFTYGVALGCAALFFVFLSDLINALSGKKEDEY